ncbi:MAG: Holliday junction resolvase RecU [bacterium]|nr:Holliday junction resolvase RecU [bacterium]
MNYPNAIKKKQTTLTREPSFSNRGMLLENELNISNEYYRSIDKAYIYKKPTPIKITNVDYPSRNKAVITKAYFTVPSTTDYNGIYKGKYIDFEAKETKSTTSFALENIHEHQIEHLKNIYRHQGISFIIVRFSTLNKTYLLMTKDLIEFISTEKRKSIPLSYFEEKAYLIKDGYTPRLDYLKIIDQIGGI